MATETPRWLTEQLLFLDNPTRLRLHTSGPKPFQITSEVAEVDLVDVIQPDGQRDTYRVAGRTPTAGGFGVSLSLEPAKSQ